MEDEKCTICGENMTKFISQDNQLIFMCSCCGSLYLPYGTRNDRVNNYIYRDWQGIFESEGNFPTVQQCSYLKFLMKSLGVKSKINVYSLTKYQAQKLISALKKRYEEKRMCTVFGKNIRIENSNSDDQLWIDGFADARIDDRKW